MTRINRIDLPEELEAGKWITGKIFMYIQATGKATLDIVTVWNGRKYRTEWIAKAGGYYCVVIPARLIRMPEEDAKLEFTVIDAKGGRDFETWIVKLKVPEVVPPPPKPFHEVIVEYLKEHPEITIALATISALIGIGAYVVKK